MFGRVFYQSGKVFPSIYYNSMITTKGIDCFPILVHFPILSILYFVARLALYLWTFFAYWNISWKTSGMRSSYQQYTNFKLNKNSKRFPQLICLRDWAKGFAESVSLCCCYCYYYYYYYYYCYLSQIVSLSCSAHAKLMFFSRVKICWVNLITAITAQCLHQRMMPCKNIRQQTTARL